MGLPHFIGIHGAARAGKNTVADIISAHYPYYAQYAFADPLKKMLRIGLGLVDAQLYGELKDVVDNRYGCSPRHLQQTLGTEWGRELINQDLWVRVAAERLEGGFPTIITDVRFDSEADFVRKDGIIVHVIGRGGIAGDHSSEAGITPHENDRYIFNTHGKSELEDTVLLMMDHLERGIRI